VGAIALLSELCGTAFLRAWIRGKLAAGPCGVLPAVDLIGTRSPRHFGNDNKRRKPGLLLATAKQSILLKR